MARRKSLIEGQKVTPTYFKKKDSTPTTTKSTSSSSPDKIVVNDKLMLLIKKLKKIILFRDKHNETEINVIQQIKSEIYIFNMLHHTGFILRKIHGKYFIKCGVKNCNFSVEINLRENYFNLINTTHLQNEPLDQILKVNKKTITWDFQILVENDLLPYL